jgi:hypothetical protein
MSQTSDSSRPAVYEIRLASHLPPEWSEWFAGLTVTPEPDGTTRLSGPVSDQAALYGLLRKVRDLGMPLVSVNRVRIDEIHPYHSQKEKE